MHDVRHWLPLKQRIAYRISALVWRTLLGLAPAYLRQLCCPIIGPIGSQSLCSSDQGLLRLPFARSSIRQNRAFSVAGPSTWNGFHLSFASFLGPYLSRSSIICRLFFLAALELGAPLSSLS